MSDGTGLAAMIGSKIAVSCLFFVQEPQVSRPSRPDFVLCTPISSLIIYLMF